MDQERQMHESVNATVEPIKRMLKQTGSKAVFGEPVRAGAATGMTVAEASFLFGGGIGFYPGAPAGTDGQQARNGAVSTGRAMENGRSPKSSGAWRLGVRFPALRRGLA